MKIKLILLISMVGLSSVAEAALTVQISGASNVTRLTTKSYNLLYSRDPEDKQKPDEEDDKPQYSWRTSGGYITGFTPTNQKKISVTFSDVTSPRTATFTANVVVKNPDDSGSEVKNVTVNP